MNISARWRWIFFMSALAATIVASVYPPGAPEAVPRVTSEHSAPAKARSKFVGAGPIMDTPSDPVGTDPFAVRDWLPPAPAAAPIAVAQPVVTVVTPPAQPQAPALPFAFVGRLQDAGAESIYLSYHDKIVVATAGTTFENTYKIKALSPQQIDFEYLPTGDVQTMALPPSDR